MWLPTPARLTLSAATLVLFAGCGQACSGFSGDIGGATFQPDGTTLMYVDDTDVTRGEDAPTPVALAMTWVTFDPQADMSRVSGDELNRLRHEMVLRDGLSLVFDDQAQLETGASFTTERNGDEETGDDGLHAVVRFAPDVLGPQSTYATFTPFGSRRSVTVSLDEVVWEPVQGAGMSGQVVIEVSRDDNDPADARTGTVEGAFLAPLVAERMAERNLSLLGAEAFLGLPLQPATDLP